MEKVKDLVLAQHVILWFLCSETWIPSLEQKNTDSKIFRAWGKKNFMFLLSIRYSGRFINTNYREININFRIVINYKERQNTRLGLPFSIFLQIGREKGPFQIFLDALDKIKTKVRRNDCFKYMLFHLKSVSKCF